MDGSTLRTAWARRAACRDMPTSMFFPTPDESKQAALDVCDTCPVARHCLDDAIARRERHGIWGGTAPGARRRLMSKSA